MSTQKYLGFPIDPELLVRIEELIEIVKEAENKRKYALKIYGVITELSDSGLDYFFVQPLQRAKIGRLKLKAIKMALSTGTKSIFAVGKSIIKTMSNDQLMLIIDLFEESMTVRSEEVV